MSQDNIKVLCKFWNDKNARNFNRGSLEQYYKEQLPYIRKAVLEEGHYLDMGYASQAALIDAWVRWFLAERPFKLIGVIFSGESMIRLKDGIIAMAKR